MDSLFPPLRKQVGFFNTFYDNNTDYPSHKLGFAISNLIHTNYEISKKITNNYYMNYGIDATHKIFGIPHSSVQGKIGYTITDIFGTIKKNHNICLKSGIGAGVSTILGPYHYLYNRLEYRNRNMFCVPHVSCSLILSTHMTSCKKYSFGVGIDFEFENN